MSHVPPLNQIAFSVVDVRRTEEWFRKGFGFLAAGGSRLMMRGLLPSFIQGLPKAASTCWWLVGRNPWFQLELFQFESPIAKLMPRNARPCDIGYRRIGIWVADFDATLGRLARLGSHPIGVVVDMDACRRACVRSPDGVFVEILEKDPLADQLFTAARDCNAAVRSVTLSTPDLAETIENFTQGFGLEKSNVALHSPQHEALWGLEGAKVKSQAFLAGDVFVEAVQYLDPIGKPWPEGYRICDQGILNIAFGARTRKDFNAVYARARDIGLTPNCRPIHVPGSGVTYVNDRLGFSIEILWMKPGKSDRRWGFEPLPIADRPAPDTDRIEHSLRIDAPVEKVWPTLANHEGMADWSDFKSVARTKDGHGDPNGYGAERRLRGPTGFLVEQVTAFEPTRLMRYRVTEGGPIVCHQGEIKITPKGKATVLSWSIRFRPRIPGTGSLLRHVLGKMLKKMLEQKLKPRLERQ